MQEVKAIQRNEKRKAIQVFFSISFAMPSFPAFGLRPVVLLRSLQVLTGNTQEQVKQKQKHLKSLVMRASNEMMEKLIAGGAEINCVRLDGLTPLMLALSKVGCF